MIKRKKQGDEMNMFFFLYGLDIPAKGKGG